MSLSSSSRPDTSSLRKLAQSRLSHFCKDSDPSVKESYLFENDHYVGVRFVAGPFSFLWKQPDDFASVMRGDLLIESISLSGETEIRRAA